MVEIVLLLIIIVVLLIVITILFISKQNLKSNIKYMSEKLSSIVKEKTSEKLLVFTDEQDLIDLLIQINGLLEHNQIVLANYAKTEISMRKMLSNISHDLKTPLTVVLGYIETILQDQNISHKELNNLLFKVQNKANEVLELINKFFDLAKLESGDKKIVLTRVNMNEICKRNILYFYDILINKNFDVKLELPSESIYAQGNEEALNRILNNLLSNAIKYGKDGKVIGLSLRYNNHEVFVDIWDKGKGINEFERDKIFERLYTLDDSRNKYNQGSGLGLTITKRLVEQLGGDIFLTSKAYEKTSFSIKLKRLYY